MLALMTLLIAASTTPHLASAAYIITDSDAASNLLMRTVGDTRYVSTALESFEPNATTPHEKRLSVKDCFKVIGAVNQCFELGNNLRPIGSSIATFILGRFKAHDCTIHGASIGGLQWRYSATGRNCDSTAQLKTIRGAIDAFLKDHVDGKCGNVCLKMTHDGTWTGYLSVTPVGAPAPVNCGADSFDSCVEHGSGSDLGARSEISSDEANELD
ncbi:hypothetical protein DFH09DRAFT_1332065 [Mycena vulgaris]|nr:hypothetical protein DFH09DRAFT_1332065 [Mycena vulgaris]